MTTIEMVAKGLDPRLYRLWVAIRNRCNNPQGQDYQYYGGRGLTVCKRWNNFAAFAADMGPHPGRRLTLDRKNNNKGYFKSNCRWATRRTQSRNRNYCKLTSSHAALIRDLYKSGFIRQAAIAITFKISQSLVSQVITGRAWR